MDRNAQSKLSRRQRRIERKAKATHAVEFFNVLTSAQLLDTTEAQLPAHRERLYPPTVALSMFILFFSVDRCRSGSKLDLARV